MAQDLGNLFQENFKLCEIGRGQTVAVLSEQGELQDYASASLQVASALGAKVVDVCVPSQGSTSAAERMHNIGKNSLQDYPELLDVCCNVDIVIDHMLLLFSKEQIAMQRAGARVLLVVEPPEILERLLPNKGLRSRVEAGERLLGNAGQLRVSNQIGTDVTFELGHKAILTEYGYTADPGRWDHWPGGFLATLAREGGVNGRVVMDVGDIIYPLKIFVRSPIEFVIQNSIVLEINGGEDARLLEKFIEKYDDQRAKAVSHIGWGLNPACEWSVDHPGIGMDGRACYGNVLFSLGPDTEFGGDNDTACHLDLPMRNCTLMLDGIAIVDEGRVLPKDMRFPTA